MNLPTDPRWREQALCTQTDPELFFPEKGGNASKAKQICAGCVVKAECLTAAVAGRERYGVWGGTTAQERRAIVRAQRAIHYVAHTGIAS